MSNRGDKTALRVQEKTIIEAAEDGKLPKVGEYTLQRNGPRGQKITVPEILMQNTDAEKGDDLDIYADLLEGYAVIDLNSG